MTIEKEVKLGDYYIDTLCVKPAYWGKRMGTMLVEAIEQKAMKNNYHSISLNVEKDHFKARRLYAYLGYETLETIMINRHEYDYMVKTLHKGEKEYD
jgi:ribosomal protein S18 acetylase RimI-like enzyme